MITIRDEWEFGVLGIYNHHRPGKLDRLFSFIQTRHLEFEGDLVVAGVFRGATLLSIAIVLKELGSTKRIYGFDSFAGFPPIAQSKDELAEFDRLKADGRITADHLAAVKKSAAWQRTLQPSKGTSASDISTSQNFSATSLDLVQRKIELIGLDNVVLVDGTFNTTMVADRQRPSKIFAGVLDCDLYQSYREAYAFIWPRLEQGGMLYLDEYYSLKFPGARRATDEFVDGRAAALEMAPRVEGDFERWHLVKR